MNLTTVIFDMDGLLIDSEPCWQEAGMEALAKFGLSLNMDQYHMTTGLRTVEWIDYWFTYFGVDKKHSKEAEDIVHELAIEKISTHAEPMPGVDDIFSFFLERRFRIGLATSSPLALVDVVTKKLGIGSWLEAITSAEYIPLGKPHPQVYLDCAAKLGVRATECLCFEDSFNGMIAVKAARMKSVVIPAADQWSLPKWDASDLKLGSLLEFNPQLLASLQ